jgi:hypothetical protein
MVRCMSLTRVCVKWSETGEVIGAVVGLGVALVAIAGSLRILWMWRLQVDPMFPERGPVARLLSGVFFLIVAVVVGLLSAWGLSHPC